MDFDSDLKYIKLGLENVELEILKSDLDLNARDLY